MTPLYDPAIERALVGLALIDGDAAQRVAMIARCFGDPEARRVAQAISGLVARGAQVGHLTVANALGGRPEDAEFVGDCVAASGGIVWADTPSEIVVRDWMRREAKRVVEDGLRGILLGTAPDIQAAIGDLSASLDAISPMRTGGVKSLADAVHEAGEALMLRAQTGKIAGVPTGWRKLDQWLDGWPIGELSIFAARPGMGKSSFWAQSIELMARQGVRILLFSPEDATETIGARVIAQHLKVTKYNAKAVDAPRIAELRDRMHGLPCVLCDRGGMTVPQMRQIARETARDMGGLDVVVIDHGGHIVNDGRDDEISRIGQTNKRLSAWAREDGLAMVMVWQLKRAAAERKDRRPELTDLRDSGHLEQDARRVVFIHREGYYDKDGDKPATDPQTTSIIIAKNSSGAVGALQYTFVPAEMRYYEQTANAQAPTGQRPQREPVRSWHDEED